MKKNLLLTVLSLTICASLVGCGAPKAEGKKETQKKEVTSSQMDSSQNTQSSELPETSTEEAKSDLVEPHRSTVTGAEEYYFADYLKGRTSIWYVMNYSTVDKNNDFDVIILYADGTMLSVCSEDGGDFDNPYRLGDFSKMSDEEIIKICEEVYYSKGLEKTNYSIHITSDKTGNNPKEEQLTDGDFSVRLTGPTSRFTIYDSHYAGYKRNNKYFFLTRVPDDGITFDLDPLSQANVYPFLTVD